MVTHQEALEKIASSNTCSEEDEILTKYWAIKIGFTEAVVVTGIIYPLGKGEAMSCNSFCRFILNKLNEVKNG